MATRGELINHGYLMAQGDVRRAENAAYVDNMQARRRINSLVAETERLRGLVVEVCHRAQADEQAREVERQAWEAERATWELERQAWRADRANLIRLLKASVADGDRLRAKNEEQRQQISWQSIQLDRLVYAD